MKYYLFVLQGKVAIPAMVIRGSLADCVIAQKQMDSYRRNQNKHNGTKFEPIRFKLSKEIA